MDRAPKVIAVAGASLAGLSAAQELRAQGFEGEIVMIGREPCPPYDRPPLSKQFLEGAMARDELALDLGQAGAQVTWRLGRTATALDLRRRSIALDDGERIAFDGLVVATGAAARRLPCNDLAGVHVLRTRGDAEALKADLDRGPGRVAVIGGGFIGTEIAATCRKRGIEVTVVEALPGLLIRVVGPEVSALLGGLHRDRGVDVRTGLSVREVIGDVSGRVRALRLSDGATLEAEVVVVAVGAVPDTAWLAGSGLDIDDGVLCDESCLAAPGVVAAGDIARWPNRRFGECRRVEHWDNAIQQGRHAARRLLAHRDAPPLPYEPVPWVWSDQFDRKLQLYGSTAGHDEVRFVDGPSADCRFVALYRRGARLSAVAGMNRTRALLAYRALLEAGSSWDAAMADKVLS